MTTFPTSPATVRDLTLLGIPADVAAPLIQYVEALNELDARRQAEKKATGEWDFLPDRYAFYAVDPAATSAGKYVQVVMGHADDAGVVTSSSVHSVVVKATGQVCKSAGWKSGPAKSTAKATKGQLLSRYTLTDDLSLAQLLQEIDPFGSYLYSR